MCISVDELTTEEIQIEIDSLTRWLDSPRTHPSDARYYAARIENLMKVLKERAEAGTI